MYRSPEGLRGFVVTIGWLGGSLLASFLGGLLLFWVVQAVWPSSSETGYPGYLSLIFMMALLIPSLIVIGRRIPYLTDWYYLLPAILFLLAFTLYPIVLTVYFGFTDYTGVRNGKPDRSTETQIVAIEGSRITLEGSVEALRCESAGCLKESVELVSGNTRVTLRVVGSGPNYLDLASPPPFKPELAYRVNRFGWVGLANFVEIFSRAGTILLPVFAWNIVFAVFAVFTSALAGLVLGLLLNNKQLRLRGFYRTTLIISWAMPVVISFQIWNAMLNQNYGPVNRILGLLGSYPIPWLNDPEWAKVAVLLVNIWLGFPYWMTATLGALTTIPDDVYEAARIDGANGQQTLFGITLPLLRQPFIPLLLGSFAYNFNNFGLIYLLTGGGPAAEGRPSTAQGTDILISWAYKTAFQTDGGQAYGLGGAISVLIFAITVGISLINFRFTGALKEVR